MNLIKKLLITLTIYSFASLAVANKFPVTIQTKFGPVTIEKQPQRVATFDYAGAENLLALGVQPLTVRSWYSKFPNSLGPWASGLLESTPVILDFPIDIKALAKQKPDVIIALWSDITEDDFARLSSIAPVIAAPEDTRPLALPWEQRAIIAGKAIGKEELAKQKVAEIKKQFARVRAKHPTWKKKSYMIAYKGYKWPSAFTEKEFRMITFNEFGLTPNPRVYRFTAEITDTYAVFHTEDFKVLEPDAFIWLNPNNDIDSIEGRKNLKAYKEGKEIILDYELTAALSHASLLSLPYLIEKVTPLLEKVLDDKK